MVATDRTLGVGELARGVEERGLDGLWLPDHTHIPLRRASPYPLPGELPEHYHRLLDPLVGLAFAAAATSVIRVGTGVLLVAQRDPITTAKALATLDQQSGGRLAVGVGFGWNLEEMADHGVDPKTRRARARDHVLAMRRLWEDDVAEYHGPHARFAASWAWPKPARRPLPVFLGGRSSALVFDHVAEYAQGWLPLGVRGLDASIPRLRERVAAAGRDPALLEIIPFTEADPGHAKLDVLERAGATEVAFNVAPGSPSAVLADLDRLASLASRRRAG
ncbi:MAG TPA: LLM class F420-dependent oxidoreductase [Pseudonocardia sp.]|nr:LLM class F420-dependent oxidoreductase [Pseudonocardia sp.]